MLCDQFLEKSSLRKCDCDIHKSRVSRTLNFLILDCWQREYDARPYEHFQINGTFFIKRMNRLFNNSDWTVLIDFLEKRRLKSLQICGIEIPDFDNVTLTQRLVDALQHSETVKLKNVSIPVNILYEFQKNITSSKVKNLDLSQNELTARHLVVLRCILIQSDVLESLNFDNCSLNENIFPILADGVHKSKSIRSIDISRPCPMSHVSIFDSSKYVNLIAELLWQNKLTHLIVRQSQINGHDLESLSEYLASAGSKLILLDLQSNNLTSHGAELLFRALASNTTLRELNLSANNLGSRGGIVVARLISYTSLESLNITHNHIEGDAMFELLCGIKKSCELRVLRIYGNQFNRQAAAVLKRLLKASVLEQYNIDVTYTWDHSKDELCVIPYFESGRVFN